MIEYIELTLLGYFAALVPGPDSLLVLKNSLLSQKLGIFSALGILVGNIVYLSLVYFGLSNLGKNPYFLAIVSFLGSIYLFYLAILSFKENFHLKISLNSNPNVKKDYKNPFFKGLITNLSNPKAILFFSSILAPFLTKNILISLIFLYTGIALAFLSIAFFGSKIPIKENEKIANFTGKIIGTLFLIFSYKLFKQFLDAINEINFHF